MPLVSVLMTVRNGGSFLEAAVASVLSQDMPDLEMVVVDDGSTDSTAATLARLAAEDARLRVLAMPTNVGIPAAANAGLAECRGKYVARLDADDLAKPSRLRKQVAFLERTGHVLCGSSIGLMDDKGRFLIVSDRPTDNDEIQSRLLKGDCVIANPSVMMRRDALVKVGGYDPQFAVAEDLDLFLRLGEVGRLANLAEPLTLYRLHDRSITQEREDLAKRLSREAVRKAWLRRGIAGMLDPAVDERPWRPQSDRASRCKFALQYGWWAFRSGEKRTASIYGVKAVMAQPWAPEAWKLLIIPAIRGAVPVPRVRNTTRRKSNPSLRLTTEQTRAASG